MANGHIYLTRGGKEVVIGGKVTFLPGASVEGAEGLFELPSTDGAVLPNVPNSEATTVAALRADFNKLIDALKASGVMEKDEK